jgi:hypothetical protein
MVEICYKKHEYSPNFGFSRENPHNNTYVNNVNAGNFAAKCKGQMQIKVEEEGGVTFTKERYTGLQALLEKNSI